MIFLGTEFCGGRYSLLPPAAPISHITAIQLFDGTYNQLFLSTDTTMTVNNLDDNCWTYDTKMNASFDSTPDAGNSGFSLNNTDHVVIRRREAGSPEWTTIYVREINQLSDFDIRIKDTYARAGVEYEYSISSFINGIENSYVVNNVYSDFEGFYITDRDCIYGTIYDVDGCDTSRNIINQTLNLLNSKYMSVVSHSALNCDSGSITGTFLKLDAQSCSPAPSESLKYRNDFKNRLANRKPLILKVDDGRIWMIRVTGSPSDVRDSHQDKRQITFEWTEIGDVNDMKTLYNAGFSDVDSRWW